MAAGCTRELLAGKSHSWVKISHRNNEQATSDQYHCKKVGGDCKCCECKGSVPLAATTTTAPVVKKVKK